MFLSYLPLFLRPVYWRWRFGLRGCHSIGISRLPTGSAKFAVSKRSPPDRDRDRSHSSRVSAHRQSSGVTDREPECWWPTITLPSVALLRTCCVEVGGGSRFCGALGCLFPTHVILWTYGQDL
ncbi:hypothetical protein CLIM01_09498 [Colletotrichum limetticola]|uniref:Uncharacterized protein n=1 Tax=Colletotrichum limetticola TaxID=1209924 RepID=A0ABQ9PNN3_9PEZI|nr:hypothetical protein CLIM01_09498 [Colletotrichum limetticola]